MSFYFKKYLFCDNVAVKFSDKIENVGICEIWITYDFRWVKKGHI